MLLVSISLFSLFCWKKKYTVSFAIPTLRARMEVFCLAGDRKRLLVLCCSVAFVYAIVALVSYFSWPAGDEWLLMARGQSNFIDRLRLASSQHFGLNGRLPELIGNIGGLDRSCWQDWVITPCFVALAPFAVWRFAKSFVEVSKPISPDFYLLISSCFLLISPLYYTSYWVNVTYTWTSVPCVLLIALMFGPQKEVHSVWKLLSAYILGMYCGWGNETQSQMLMLAVPFILACVYVKCRRVSVFQIACLLGVFSGCYMLFSSGSFACRAAYSVSPLSGFSTEEIRNFVTDLNWEKVISLNGSSAFALLVDIPLLSRLYFIPYSLLMYMEVAAIPLFLLLLLSIIAVLKKEWKKLLFALFLSLISLEMAVAYVAGALPNYPSYIPPAVVVVCACSYLYLGTSIHKLTRWGISCLFFVHAVYVYVPDICIASTYKNIDWNVDKSVATQSAIGIKHIVVPNPTRPAKQYPDGYFYGTPRRRLFRGYGAHQGPLWAMIYVISLKKDVNSYDNKKAVEYFNALHYDIESIRLEE